MTRKKPCPQFISREKEPVPEAASELSARLGVRKEKILYFDIGYLVPINKPKDARDILINVAHGVVFTLPYDLAGKVGIKEDVA